MKRKSQLNTQNVGTHVKMSERKRLYVGGLVEGIKEDEVRQRFTRFGEVSDVEIRKKNEADNVKTFAYVNLNISESNLAKCMQVYNHSKWKGKELTIQVAKENFMDRLKRERQEREDSQNSAQKSEMAVDNHDEVKNTVVKNKAEGAAVENKRNWVVGKSGQILPVVFIRDKDKKKVRKMDPTQQTGGHKVIDSDGETADAPVDTLTWELEEKPRKIPVQSVTSVQSSLLDVAKKPTPTNGIPQKKPIKKIKCRRGAGTLDFLSDSESEDGLPTLKKPVGRTYRSSASSADEAKPKEVIKPVKKKVLKKSKKKVPPKADSSSEDTDDVLSQQTGQTILPKKMSTVKSKEVIRSGSPIEDGEVAGTSLASLPGWLESDSDSEMESPAKVQKIVKKTPVSKQAKNIGAVNNKFVKSDTYMSSDDEDDDDEDEEEEKARTTVLIKNLINSSKNKAISAKPVATAKAATSSSRNVIKPIVDYHSKVLDEYTSGLQDNVTNAAHLIEDEEDMDIFEIIAAGKVKTLYSADKSGHKTAKIPVKTKATVQNKDSNVKTKADTLKPKDVQSADKPEKKPKLKNMSKDARHEASNQKRLESLFERKKESESQKLLVRQALAGVDKKSNNKKITFDSDDDEEMASPVLEAGNDDEMGNRSDDEDKGKSNQTKKLPGLFNSDSGSENESESSETDHFKIRPEYEGKAGKKLLKLQSRFGNDSRFKMGAQFVESDSENEESDTDEKVPSQSEVDAEKARSMEILRGIVGSGALMKRKKEAKGAFKDISTLHYDPMKQDHQKFEIPEEKRERKSKETKKSKKTELTAEVAEVPEVSSERFFEVAAPLKDVFGRSQDAPDQDEGPTQTSHAQGFSLLAMFGGDTPAADGRQEEMDVDTSQVIEKKSSFPAMETLGYGDSSEEEDMDQGSGDTQQKISTEPADDVFKAKQETFFFVENDPRIKEALEYFHCSEDEETIREQWKEKRPFLVDAYTTRRKRALRNKRNTTYRLMMSKRGRKK